MNQYYALLGNNQPSPTIILTLNLTIHQPQFRPGGVPGGASVKKPLEDSRLFVANISAPQVWSEEVISEELIVNLSHLTGVMIRLMIHVTINGWSMIMVV